MSNSGNTKNIDEKKSIDIEPRNHAYSWNTAVAGGGCGQGSGPSGVVTTSTSGALPRVQPAAPGPRHHSPRKCPQAGFLCRRRSHVEHTSHCKYVYIYIYIYNITFL